MYPTVPMDREKIVDKENAISEHCDVVDNDRYHFDAADLDKVERRLKQRHVQMYV